MKTKKLAVTGVLAAVSTVLMFLSVSVPFMPPFIKLDISELPAILASFSLGPLYGVAVAFVKNLVNLPFTTTGGIGEVSNFIISSMFVFPAGLIYMLNKNRFTAFVGSLTGSVLAASISIFTNYYIVYPVYANFIPFENILAAYQAINPNVDNLWQAILWFNFPFTFFKCMISVIITFIIYKKVSPLLKG